MSKRIVTALALLLALILAAPAWAANPPAPWSGMVARVKDGDTVVIWRAGQKVDVRLAYVDAPETKKPTCAAQPHGVAATRLVKGLALGVVVRVEPTDIDRYKRTAARIILPDGRDLGAELVKAGLAWVYRAYAPPDSPLYDLEDKAKAKRLGLWKAARPVNPAEHRAACKRRGGAR
jgi:endonuclease YncB( thermonuclease family)